MNARYYDPHLGSFISPDPAMENLNHYAYCSANPIKYTDPTGLAETTTTDDDDDDDNTTTTTTTTKEEDKKNEVKNENDNKKEKENKQIEAKEKFEKAREEFIKKYKNDNIKEGSPIDLKDKHRISDGDNKNHKKRTEGKDEKNKIVFDIAAKKGTKIYTVTDIKFKANSLRWCNGDNKSHVSKYNKNLETRGSDWGYRLKGENLNGTKDIIYAHLNPDAQVAKDFEQLQSLAKAAGIDFFVIPQGVQIGEIGITGDISGPHLHLEINDI